MGRFKIFNFLWKDCLSYNCAWQGLKRTYCSVSYVSNLYIQGLVYQTFPCKDLYFRPHRKSYMFNLRTQSHIFQTSLIIQTFLYKVLHIRPSHQKVLYFRPSYAKSYVSDLLMYKVLYFTPSHTIGTLSS